MAVVIKTCGLNLNDFNKVVYQNEKVVLDKKSLAQVEKNFQFLKDFAEDKIIYGVNTGFGPMAPYRIKKEEQLQLQYNLIRSHASGAGSRLPDESVRAVLLVRLQALMNAHSGITPHAPLLLAKLLNEEIYPLIPEHGGVGASGDLVQLSHVALVLIGEGEVSYQGKMVKTPHLFKQKNIKPLEIQGREGLAIINGTSAMTGIGLTNVLKARKLLNWSLLSSSILHEMFEAYDDSFSDGLNRLRLHKGQNEIAKAMRHILKDSKRIKKRHEYLYNNKIKEYVLKERVQEYYSLRCTPQILGPILEEIDNAEKILIEEANSVNDNPIIDSKKKNVLHGGNFHGDYVSYEMDKLKIAITKLSMLSERQLNFILNDKLNDVLPAFVNLGTLGLNLGMQGVQFTATSTVAGNQTLSFPMYVHSIPNNKDNQDIVSMGTNSANMARKVIENSFEVLAIQLMAIIQAIDYLKIQSSLSSKGLHSYKQLRNLVPIFKQDTVKYVDIEKIKEFIKNTDLEF